MAEVEDKEVGYFVEEAGEAADEFVLVEGGPDVFVVVAKHQENF